MSNAMDKALAAAKEAAENTPAVIDSNTNVAAAPPRPAQALSLDDFQRETPDIDVWLKVATDGISIRDEKLDGFTEAKVRMVMRLEDFQTAKRLNYGNPPTYKTSFDGVYSTEGELWSVVIDNAKRATGNDNVQDYMSVQVQGELLEDAGGGKVGDNVGYQTSKTQGKPLNSLIKTVKAAGIADDEPFEVIVGVKEVKSNKGYKPWAVHTYEFVGRYDEDAE